MNAVVASPACRCAQEYRSACEWSAAHALRTSPAQRRRPGDCVDWERAGPVLEEVLASYSDRDIAAQSVQINEDLGWIETAGGRYCPHGAELPAKLLEAGLARRRGGFAISRVTTPKRG